MGHVLVRRFAQTISKVLSERPRSCEEARFRSSFPCNAYRQILAPFFEKETYIAQMTSCACGYCHRRQVSGNPHETVVLALQGLPGEYCVRHVNSPTTDQRELR